MAEFPLTVTTVSGKGSALNAVEFDSNLIKTRDCVNDLEERKADKSDLTSHTTDTNNPHNVTAAQLGAANILTQIKTVDGAGSGLDADTLDGYHAGNASGNIPISNGTVNANLNADTLDGYHVTDSGVWWDRIPVIRSDGVMEVGQHIDFHLTSDSIADFEPRLQALDPNNLAINSNKIWHAGNDGSGSGLDADTVDGIQASSFLRSDTGEMNLSGITFYDSLGSRIIKPIGTINDAKAGIILFAKVYSGTLLPKQGFVGKLFVDRGSIISGSISYEYDVVCTTAYSNGILTLTGNDPNCYLVKVNYNGDDYYGVYSQATSARNIILDGFIYNYNLDGNGNPYIFIPDASGYTVTKVNSTQIYNNQNQVYTQNNILGTVSQSGGVPTGAIIETGSNANGDYIKFANGVAFCYYVYFNQNVNLAPSGVFDIIPPFPLSFIEGTPTFRLLSGTTVRAGGFNLGLALETLRYPHESSWRTRIVNTTSYTIEVICLYFFAIGRWY